MSRRDIERVGFLAAQDREAYLREHSNLPGPRGNLELLDVASELAGRSEIERWAALPPAEEGQNTPGEFVVAVGVVGLGRLVARGDPSALKQLRHLAGDPRWRVREAVAIGLQAWGDADCDALIDEMERWAGGSPLEGRAAVAALCEPRLLSSTSRVARTIAILERLTDSVGAAPDPRSDAVRILRQALGYGWSVAVAAAPAIGLPAFERLLDDPNPDVRWLVRENLGKSRLAKAAPVWVEGARARIRASS